MRRSKYGYIGSHGKRRRSRVGWILALVLLLFVVALSVRRYDYCLPKDVAWLKTTPIAHRGLHTDEFDENSIGAFSNAISNGYAIELDVRLTKDGYVVVIHDDKLDRLFGIDNKVSNMTLAELKELRFPKSKETIPTLAETMAHIAGRTPVLIEIKNFGLAGKLEEATLKVLEGYQGEYAYQAFGPFSCRWMRQHDKDTPVGLLLADLPMTGTRLFRNFKDNFFAAISRPSFIAYNYATMNDEITKGYRDNGVTVLGWTVDDSVLKDKSYLRYVDNVIFEINAGE
jgi:glycerophosphoryl diester phosphodiesterase